MVKVHNAKGAYDCTGIICENDVRLVFYSYGVVMNTINIKDFKEANRMQGEFSHFVTDTLRQFADGKDISLV
ncbi:hypothetical protein PBV87_19875 [Niameybacter massiliensis]|uniref:Uncharacterized protein n=1 Tax=Holtiella tumoricola TaxID=3018743 RepID=A0AA42DSE8_9FIRM|nr:hypothetical protein [Holtiella tumoricola]MDA3733734.1 hypothetical protein [Holtiella tumoricola]